MPPRSPNDSQPVIASPPDWNSCPVGARVTAQMEHVQTSMAEMKTEVRAVQATQTREFAAVKQCIQSVKVEMGEGRGKRQGVALAVRVIWAVVGLLVGGGGVALFAAVRGCGTAVGG